VEENLILRLDKFNEARQYWLAKLPGELSGPRLTADFPARGQYEAALHRLELGSALTGKLKQMSKHNDIALYVFLLTAFKILLFRLTGQADLIVAAPVLSQSRQDTNRFVLLRDFLTRDIPFKNLLMEVKETAAAAYKYQYYPLEKLLELIDLQPGSRLDQVILLLESIHRQDFLEERETEVGRELSIVFREGSQGLEGKMIYNAKRFNAETLERWAECFAAVLARVAADPGVQCGEIDLVSEAEKKRLLLDFNRPHPDLTGAADSLSPRCLHECVERQAAKTPGKKAIIYKGKYPGGMPELTYSQLDKRAGQWARELRHRGVTAGRVVGLMVEDTFLMAVGLLAILKAGGAYLPLDTEYPPERIRFMLKDTGVQWVLTQSSLDVPGENHLFLFIDGEPPTTEETAPDGPVTASSDPAYLIYTSGTTGQPRGVVVEHGSVVDKLLARKRSYGLDGGDVALQLFSHSFDGFVTSFFTPLASGAAVVLLGTGDIRAINKIKKTLAREQVTHFICIPVLFRVILEHLTPGEFSHLKLRVVTLAGDKLAAPLLELTRTRAPHLEIAHEYGVTEASVVSTLYRHQEREDQVRLGKPLGDTRLYILDPWGKLQPIGIPGELCIAGGLARGYLNRPELTAERFCLRRPGGLFSRKPPPWTPRKSVLLYRSGDLVRWHPDGNLEFLGRLDHQVKVRGNRIELGEIESQLQGHESVKEAVVTAWGEPASLCAYWVAAGSGEVPDISQLRAFLARRIPSYMVPSQFIQLDKLPLTAAGKIHRQALPTPDSSRPPLEANYVVPETSMQKTIAAAWQEVLGLEQVGIYDNFFDIGGNSMDIITLGSRLEEIFGKEIPVVTIFRYPTIHALEGYLNDGPVTENSSQREQDNAKLTKSENLLMDSMRLLRGE
jgi:amino acid adenylation domain-containing protein